MLNIPEIKARYEAATDARPQDSGAAFWVRRYREDIPQLVMALEEAQAETKALFTDLDGDFDTPDEVVDVVCAHLRAIDAILGESE